LWHDGESRYRKLDWQTSESQTSEDYRSGRIKSADSIDEMFEEIEKILDESQVIEK
jgi:hypothetical protein